MILAEVLGTVVSTRKDSHLLALKLLLVREVDAQFKPTGNHVVAADAVGAGTGELVLVAQGSSARMTEVFGRLGIGRGVQVVAYDDTSGHYAARLWWMLRFMGHGDRQRIRGVFLW